MLNVPNNDWDIAFNLQPMNSSIRTNDGMGVELYSYNYGDTSSWNNINTGTIQMVTNPMYNSDSNWSLGAFDRNQLGHPDYGWGVYNMTTHEVIGDSIFIIKTVSGNWKKLVIEKLATGIYTFRYANLDGSNQIVQSINKSNYPGKNFIYYSLDQDLIQDREPLSSDWDITFTKYSTDYPTQQGTMPYSVTGVLQNNGIEVAEANNIASPGTYTNYNGHSFLTDINEIGYDWKYYDFASGSYLLDPNTCFFVKDYANNVYRIVFTAFGGSATGDIEFNAQLVSSTPVLESSFVSAFSIYPNPSSTHVTITYEISSKCPEVSVYDLIGKKVYHQKLSSDTYAATIIPTSHLKKGLYIVCISDENNKKLQHKLIVN